MDRVTCKTKTIINVLPDTGPLLDVEYIPDPRHPWQEVATFLGSGKFVLHVESPSGITSIQPVKVSTATSLTGQPGILVSLGPNQPKQVTPGCSAWLEKL